MTLTISASNAISNEPKPTININAELTSTGIPPFREVADRP